MSVSQYDVKSITELEADELDQRIVVLKEMIDQTEALKAYQLWEKCKFEKYGEFRHSYELIREILLKLDLTSILEDQRKTKDEIKAMKDEMEMEQE